MAITTFRYFFHGIDVPVVKSSLDPTFAAAFALTSAYRPQMVDVSYEAADIANLNFAMNEQGWSPAGAAPTQPIRLTGVAASIPSTVLTPIQQEGTYQIVMYAVCTTPGAGAVDIAFEWTDAAGVHSIVAGTLDLTGTNFAQRAINIHAIPATNLNYSATIVGGGGGEQFSLYAGLAYLF
jgi:hypothetical protein